MRRTTKQRAQIHRRPRKAQSSRIHHRLAAAPTGTVALHIYSVSKSLVVWEDVGVAFNYLAS